MSEITENIISVERFEDGTIVNKINYLLFIKHMNPEDPITYPDYYLTFIIKSIIDDFGDAFVAASQGRINKEQFEASLMENLKNSLSDKTRVE